METETKNNTFIIASKKMKYFVINLTKRVGFVC